MRKLYFKGLDMLKPNAVEPTKLPRTCVIPVIKDPQSGVLNAGAYSAGVASVRPYHIIFGIKSYITAAKFRDIDTFAVALGSKDQVDNVWITAFHAPPGIDEIELANWHPLELPNINSPGIKECRINLECRKLELIKLPDPWRSIMVAEVIGISADRALIEMPRSESIQLLPLHEGGMYIEDGTYGLSTMKGEMNPPAIGSRKYAGDDIDGKIYVNKENMYTEENNPVLANSIFPRPCYIVLTKAEDDRLCAELFTLGFIQSTEPSVHIPVKRDSITYNNIKRTGYFTISVPTIELVDKVVELEKNPGSDPVELGFSLTPPNMYDIPSLDECPINIDCDAYMIKDISGTNYALVLGIKIGATVDEEVGIMLDQTKYPPNVNMDFINDLYSHLIYRVFDVNMEEKIVSYDKYSTIPVKPLPTWGSRYHGAWWGEEPSCINYWLIELCQMHILSKREYEKICNELRLWNNSKGAEHLKRFYADGELEAIRQRLTRLLKEMVWAHHDMWRWDRVHALIDQLPDPYIYHGHHEGPMYFPYWSGDLYI